MATPQEIKYLIEEIDEKLFKMATTKHEQLAKLLESALPAIAACARLMHISTQFEDFDLSSKSKQVTNTSFFGSLAQITNKLCSSIMLACDRFTQISISIENVRTNKVHNLLEFTDEQLSKELVEYICSESSKLASQAKQVAEAFNTVTVLINGIRDRIISTKYTRKRLARTFVDEALDVGGKQLNVVKNKLTEITRFFTQFASFLRVDLVGGSRETRSASSSIHILAQQKRFAENVVKLSTMSIRVSSLAQVFLGIKDTCLEQLVRNLSSLMEDPKNNKEAFVELEKRCLEQADLVKTTIVESKVALVEILKTVSESLRYSDNDDVNTYSAIVADIIRDEESNDVAMKQEYLESLLVAAPMSIALLSELCLISTSSRDFQLQPPISGFKHAKSNWFRGCLHQVINHGSSSFSFANKSLAQIEMHSRNIPSEVLDILDVILYGEPEDIETELPTKMNSIIDNAAACNLLATETELQFSMMIDLINEISETCTATRSVVEVNTHVHANIVSTEKVLEDLSSLQLLKSDAKKIIKVLMDGLLGLIKVRQQWQQLVRFFNKLTNLIRIEMFEPLESFREHAELQAQKRVERGKAITTFARKTLQIRAREISQKGFQAHMLASMYLRIAKKHISGPLSMLDQLLTITDVSQAESLRKDITTTCVQSKREIKDMAEQHTVESFRLYKQKLTEIENATMTDEEQQAVIVSEVIRNEDMVAIAKKLEYFSSNLLNVLTSFSVLSEICVLSKQALDFQQQTLNSGFIYSNTDWLWASVLQLIINGSSPSFALARDNMTQIETHLQQILYELMEILEVTLNRTTEDFEQGFLEKIEPIIPLLESCDTLALTACQCFAVITDLINVLQKANKKDDIKALLERLKTGGEFTTLRNFFTEFSQLIQRELSVPLRNLQGRKDFSKKKIIRIILRNSARNAFKFYTTASMYLEISKELTQGPLFMLMELLTATDKTKAHSLQKELQTACERLQGVIQDMAKQRAEESLEQFKQKWMEIKQVNAGDDDQDEEYKDKYQDNAEVEGGEDKEEV